MSIEVTEWVSWDAAWAIKRPLGDEHIAALGRCIVKNRIWEEGYWHQNDPHGAPKFSDGAALADSMKNWSWYMAQAWNPELGTDFGSYSFAYDTPDEPDWEAVK